MFRWFVTCLTLGLAACGGSNVTPDGGPPDAAATCTNDDQCGDGIFCNGQDLCRPMDPGADALGCVNRPVLCLDGQSCREDLARCFTECAVTRDADGDGVDALDCGGDDCDDADGNRFPDGFEVCDLGGHDEDCDPSTFGERDEDGDGALSSQCCNGQRDGTVACGLDCDDSDLARRPGQLEVCDAVDNDCDGIVDEAMVTVTWFADEDGDGFGAAGAGMESCAPIAGHSLLGTDCDDADIRQNPLADEDCGDGDDQDCDGLVDEQCGDTGMPDTGMPDGGSPDGGSSDGGAPDAPRTCEGAAPPYVGEPPCVGAEVRACLDACTGADCWDCTVLGVPDECATCVFMERIRCLRDNGCDDVWVNQQCCFDEVCGGDDSCFATGCAEEMAAFESCAAGVLVCGGPVLGACIQPP